MLGKRTSLLFCLTACNDMSMQEAFATAAMDAGVADTDHAVDMIMYAAHASQLPVKRSGQSAFSWIPLVTVAAAVQNLAAADKRAAFLPSILRALTDVSQHLHACSSLELHAWEP